VFRGFARPTPFTPSVDANAARDDDHSLLQYFHRRATHRTVRQAPVPRSAVFAAAADAAESEVDEAPAAEAKPRRAAGKGPRKPKPGPAQTMKVDELTVGQEYSGAVVSVTDFGAFVNIGCDVDGLVHISQLSNDFVKNVADVVAIGQDMSVRVLSVDLEKKKFSLSAKTQGGGGGGGGDYSGGSGERGERPRQARARKERKERPKVPVSAGDEITGKIASVASFGLFIEVGNGFQGMLHSSQIKLPEGVEDHFTHFKEGDEVSARVASVQREKISLTQLTEEEAKNQKEIETKGLATGTSVCCDLSCWPLACHTRCANARPPARSLARPPAHSLAHS
jgi:elongation factor Ts